MDIGKNVLIIGIDPALAIFPVDSGMNEATILSQLHQNVEELNSIGFTAELCLVDLGETAEAIVIDKIISKEYCAVVLGGGLRTLPENMVLFEKVLNIVHQYAPRSRICFNANPATVKEAVLRWVRV